jgi:hypothetical protein
MVNTLNIFGLILNLVGTLLIAFSFGNPPSRAEQMDKKGRIISLAAFLHPICFKIGIWLVVIGFILMLASAINIV